eukprot:1155808-Pelagomonas_calceolata.AAC.4
MHPCLLICNASSHARGSRSPKPVPSLHVHERCALLKCSHAMRPYMLTSTFPINPCFLCTEGPRTPPGHGSRPRINLPCPYLAGCACGSHIRLDRINLPCPHLAGCVLLFHAHTWPGARAMTPACTILYISTCSGTSQGHPHGLHSMCAPTCNAVVL